MHIGVPKEIKVHEYRVGMTPQGVNALTSQGHKVLVESEAGDKIGFTDENYLSAGAEICLKAEEVWQRSQLIIKVKEPLAEETPFLREDHLLFTYLHLAANKRLTEELITSGCTAIAYETITNREGHLPLLAPMSEVAGRMSVQAGAHCLEISQHGRGVLLAGVPGVEPGKVVILGGGVVGTNAAQMAMGLGADTYVFDTSPKRLRELDTLYHGRLKTCFSTREQILEAVSNADLIIGAVLIPGAEAPKLIRKDDLAMMQKGAVVVDVAIDQGGCFESSRATTHQQPTYVEKGIVHYCVANMPGAVARSSTLALTNVTLPYILNLANSDPMTLFKEDRAFAEGLNIHKGGVFCAGVASAFEQPLRLIDHLP